MAENDSGLAELFMNAASDPRFAEVFEMVKNKAQSGELDPARIIGELSAKQGAPHESTGSEDASPAFKCGAECEGGHDDKMRDAGNFEKSDKCQASALRKGAGESGNLQSGKKKSPASFSSDFARHRNLLSALRPYLSEGKRSAVDSLLKLGQISGAIEAVMNLTDGGEKG